jgi:hypothetical protein
MPRQPAGIAAAVAVLCAALSMARPADATLTEEHAECGASHVRLTDASLQAGFDLGMARSAIFRSLVESLRGSDLIVYASSEASMPTPIAGEIHFVSVAGTHRYLRVFVRADLSPWERAGMLAHELQHAIEIAAAADVHDAASMDALYERIGYDVGIDRHETDAARRIGEQVLREMAPGAGGSGGR